MSFSTLGISGALRGSVTITDGGRKVRKLTYLPRVAKTSTRGILCVRGAWPSGAEEREKRRFIIFLIPDPSAWRVVVAARLLRLANYQRMNLLVCIGAHLGRGCGPGMVFCRTNLLTCWDSFSDSLRGTVHVRTTLSLRPVAMSWLSSEKATPQTVSRCSSGSPMGSNAFRSKNRVVLSHEVVANLVPLGVMDSE
ncbi:hypothetical protein DFJ58DRAFT_782554 [Suillus subalutaceus]|uniref:uncharacterized protein n=1 Tax=Suillus subalutaceus TaxID=48586 RepID=UPI001B875528|nr:uncharacterized protein DFJ58DRAFT_782554 [Suillus subalutaceus]KAG1858033.1 hypothetical protein DFJ58DRAFT_782554 [Suillus subalutaceus]